MTRITADLDDLTEAGTTFCDASALVNDEVSPLRQALQTLENSPQIVEHLATSGSGLATLLGLAADEMASIGTGLAQVVTRFKAGDIFITAVADPSDAAVGGFTIGPATHGRADGLAATTDTAGFGFIRDGSEVEVDSIYGPAVHRQSDDQWFLRGTDGQWYLLDVPTSDAGRYGFSVTGTQEGMVEFRGGPSGWQRAASVAAMGAGPTAGSPGQYAHLDWGTYGTEPLVGREVNPAMASDADDHPSPAVIAGSDIVVNDPAHHTPSPRHPGYGPSGGAVASGVDAFSMVIGGIGAATNNDGRYQGARMIFTEDGNGRRRVVIQGASITNYGSSPIANGYNVVGFEESGNPITEKPRIVTFDMGKADGSCIPLPPLKGTNLTTAGPS